MRQLEWRALLIADPEHPSLDLVPDSSLDHLQAASVAYRIAINRGRISCFSARTVTYRRDCSTIPPGDGRP